MAQTTKARASARKAAAKKPPRRKGTKLRRKSDTTHPVAGVGAYVSGLLLKGKSTDEVLRQVGIQFPKASTSRASVAWYRSRLKQEGKL